MRKFPILRRIFSKERRGDPQRTRRILRAAGGARYPLLAALRPPLWSERKSLSCGFDANSLTWNRSRSSDRSAGRGAKSPRRWSYSPGGGAAPPTALIGKPSSRQASRPPASGRTRLTPPFLSSSATRALEASFGQVQ